CSSHRLPAGRPRRRRWRLPAGAASRRNYTVGRRMLPIGDDARRARLAARHHLAASSPAADVVAVARALVALHSTAPATVFLSVAARMAAVDVPAIERVLYDDRALVRILG